MSTCVFFFLMLKDKGHKSVEALACYTSFWFTGSVRKAYVNEFQAQRVNKRTHARRGLNKRKNTLDGQKKNAAISVSFST